jgi:hypothetical protein
MRTFVGLTLLAALILTGCSGEDPFEAAGSRSAAPNALGVTTDTVDSVGSAAPKQQTDQPKPPPKREKAQAGVTGRGNYGQGFVLTPFSTYVRVQEKMVFEQVKQALNLYKGEKGHMPKSHEEFMEKIVKFNNLKLPELPAGKKYVYDPEKGELFVSEPR